MRGGMRIRGITCVEIVWVATCVGGGALGASGIMASVLPSHTDV